jgi:HPt (histidine-containing phosphotransfer) domain-containing protein
MSIQEAHMPNQRTKRPVQPPIYSQLADDPDMAELIDLFVGELPKRIATLSEAWRTREFQSLQRLAHQLKGSCAGYGFPSIGTAAAKVEETIRSKPIEEIKLDELNAGLKELIDLCHRASASGAAKAA